MEDQKPDVRCHILLSLGASSARLCFWGITKVLLGPAFSNPFALRVCRAAGDGDVPVPVELVMLTPVYTCKLGPLISHGEVRLTDWDRGNHVRRSRGVCRGQVQAIDLIKDNGTRTGHTLSASIRGTIIRLYHANDNSIRIFSGSDDPGSQMPLLPHIPPSDSPILTPTAP